MSPDDIINAVCQVTGVTSDEVKAITRKREVEYTRKLAIYYLNKKIPDPHFIGKYLNKPVHVIYYHRNFFDKHLNGDNTLRYLKSQCDKLIDPAII